MDSAFHSRTCSPVLFPPPSDSALIGIVNSGYRQLAIRLVVGIAVAALLVLCLVSSSYAAAGHPSSPDEQMLFDAVNHERALRHLRPLQWDTALANAARLHTSLLADHDSLSHRFDGEADLQTRLRNAGASFRMVAENVAEANDVATLHIAWMNSAPHRANILDPDVDSIGIAIERRGNQYYATQDFAAVVAALSREQQEQQISRLLRAGGLLPSNKVEDARKSCDSNRGGGFTAQPAAIAHFETTDLSKLPSDLARMVSSGKFRHAAVGACEIPNPNAFTRFRLTVLFYP